MDNRFNKIFPSFNLFSSKFSPGDRLIDVFPSCFSFHSTNRKNKERIKAHIHKLDKITFQVSIDLKTVVIISDTSIKNQVATSIVHIHVHNSLVIHLSNISGIIIIMDSIHSAKRIFDLSSHSYQIHASSISSKLGEFFVKDHSNSIEFWDCPSCCKWTLHDIVDKETKKFNFVPMFPCKSSWDLSRKNECNEILSSWKMTFQASDGKGHHFLELLDENLKPIELLYSKGGLWLKFFRHSNSLCARASRAIINHAPIDEYWLRFFSQKEFKCPCGLYPIKTRMTHSSWLQKIQQLLEFKKGYYSSFHSFLRVQ